MTRLGVIGKPSDWLIASNVDYKNVKNKFNIELINIDINELIDAHVIQKSLQNLNIFMNLSTKTHLIKKKLIKHIFFIYPLKI